MTNSNIIPSRSKDQIIDEIIQLVNILGIKELLGWEDVNFNKISCIRQKKTLLAEELEILLEELETIYEHKKIIERNSYSVLDIKRDKVYKLKKENSGNGCKKGEHLSKSIIESWHMSEIKKFNKEVLKIKRGLEQMQGPDNHSTENLNENPILHVKNNIQETRQPKRVPDTVNHSRYREKCRILEKNFRGSMIYMLKDATKLMEDILKEKVDYTFVKRYLDEHDCILIEDKKKSVQKRSVSTDFTANKSFPKEDLDTPKKTSINKHERISLGNLSKRKHKRKYKNLPKSHLQPMNVIDRNELLVNNINLVRETAEYYSNLHKNNRLDYDDLFSEGVIGLINAIENYGQTRGRSFSEYAFPWIRKEMIKAIFTKGTPVRIPFQLLNQIRLVRMMEQVYFQIHGELKISDICKAFSISIEKYNSLKTIEHQFLKLVSLDNMINFEDRYICSNQILNDNEKGLRYNEPEFDNPEKLLEEREKKAYILGLQNVLNERESKVISLRLGLEDGKEKTLEEVGRIIGVTRERIRQVEAKALSKLRSIPSKYN